MTTINRKIRIIPLLAAAIAALVAWGAVTTYILVSSSTDNAPAMSPMVEGGVQNKQSTSTLPARLLIPSLHINASVQHVGRTAAGLMRDPSNFTDVAWYKGGPEPGQEGSAVIAGHLDNALGLDGVFKHLNDIQTGQDIEVRTAAGGTLYFRVTDIENYPYTQVPEDIFTKTGGSYLNLITCAGVWLQQERTYDHRLVVYTTLIQS